MIAPMRLSSKFAGKSLPHSRQDDLAAGILYPYSIACCTVGQTDEQEGEVCTSVANVRDALAIISVINAAFRQAESFLIDRDRVDSETVRKLLQTGIFLVADSVSTLRGCVYVELKGDRSYLGFGIRRSAIPEVRPGFGVDERRRGVLCEGRQPLHGFADRECANGAARLLPSTGMRRNWHGAVYAGPEPEVTLSLCENVEAAHLNCHSTTASASISTRISGEISALTWTIDVAGRMSRKNSPCALPIFSHSAMLVTYIRVRTTSFMLAPAFFKALSMFFKVCTACAYTSPTPMIFPSGPVAVVPETCTYAP